jgi:hypothetical protein
MQLFITNTPLAWGELDLPLLGITSDWSGTSLAPPLGFSLATDPSHLWFVATRQAPATPLPGSSSGIFTPGLWEYDVAELFIADGNSGQYLEFNIAPNGAWWAAKFSSTRIQSEEQPAFSEYIQAYHDDPDPDSWLVALSIPLAFLKEQIGFGSGSSGNPAFIMNSPEQTFHSAARLPGTEPDFHQPERFPKLIPCKLPVL